MKIAIAQINPTVGDFKGTVQKIAQAYERASRAGARLLLTPELSLCGYPPHDLLERPEIIEYCDRAIDELSKLTLKSACALVVGHVGRNRREIGRAVVNRLSVIEKGEVIFEQDKSLLPTYDVFDESRYFEPAAEVKLWDCDGVKIAMAICEDMWGEDRHRGRKIYAKTPVEEYKRQGAELILTIAASPYEWEKRERREKIHGDAAERVGAPLIYLNQVGANDEILFDGASFAWSKGALVARLPAFEESFGVFEYKSEKLECVEPTPKAREDVPPHELAVLERGLVLGIRDYFRKTGFKSALIGLSGGIDSAVVAALTVRALGKEAVTGIAMPSQYSSGHSLEDAEALARNLGIRFEVRPIKFAFATLNRELSESGKLAPVALENLQSRLRGLTLMTLSNDRNALVVTTGNKSEIAMGYCTLYGDMVGAIAPIGDLFKTRVYELAHYINDAYRSPIPERSISKAPSAELRPNQTDQDSLPPYEQLDAVLQAYLENGAELAALKREFPYPWLIEVLRKLEMNEYKRIQAAPVLKTSPKAFGIGRRIPIAKGW